MEQDLKVEDIVVDNNGDLPKDDLDASRDVIIVDRDVPIPTTTRGQVSPWIELLEKMEVGQSFICPEWAKFTTIRSLAHRHGIRVITKRLADGKRRIWKAPYKPTPSTVKFERKANSPDNLII